jgi:LacI family transcriptional regulator
MSKPSGIKKRITISDVAEAAGVTKSTVSLSLAGKGNFSPQTRLAIKRAARRLNYEPNPHARRLSIGHFDKTIALLTMGLDLSVGTKKLQLIQGLLVAAGFEAPLYVSAYGSGTTGHEKLDLIKGVCRSQPRAIICNSHQIPVEAWPIFESYQEAGGTVICYDDPTDFAADKVLFDREENTYQATKHLLELGHRDIALAASTGPSGDRLNGFLRALAEFDVEPHDEWLLGKNIIDDAGFLSGIYEEGGARQAVEFLKLRRRPTAVCLLDDHAAVGFAAELERSGLRVPEDVSVVGHDDLPIARYGHLPLTTATHPVEEIAHSVVDLLTSRLNGYDGPPREITIRGKLVVRQSAVPLSAATNEKRKAPVLAGV